MSDGADEGAPLETSTATGNEASSDRVVDAQHRNEATKYYKFPEKINSYQLLRG